MSAPFLVDVIGRCVLAVNNDVEPANHDNPIRKLSPPNPPRNAGLISGSFPLKFWGLKGQPLLQRRRSLPLCVGALPVRQADASPAPRNTINRMNSVHATTQQSRAIWCRPAAQMALPACSSPYAIQGTEPTITAARYWVGSEILGRGTATPAHVPPAAGRLSGSREVQTSRLLDTP
ncbi:hypothetical protein B0H14DRAFT_3138478 [Mycena olivaceomarginata]|nr:hypothetical protein B0H14DRAFT_3138478 [Mycena olivaceomarginata]